MDEEGFVRQRRNLIVVSLVLFLIQGTEGLTLTEINILGNKADLKHYLQVDPILWVAWGYFLLRYWQAFKEYGSPRFLTAFRGQLLKRINERLNDYKNRTPSPEKIPHGVDPTTIFPAVIDEMKLTGWLGASATLVFNYQDQHGSIKGIKEEWASSRKEVIVDRIVALINTTFNSSIVTELYLPFIIAMFPVFRLATIST